MVQKNLGDEMPKSSQGHQPCPGRRKSGIEVRLDDHEHPDPRRVDLMISANVGRKQRLDL